MSKLTTSFTTIFILLIFFGKPVIAAETIYLQSKQIKDMATLNGTESADADASAPAGAKFGFSLPVFITFGADGCFAGIFDEASLESLEMKCKVPLDTWSLGHLLETQRVDATPELFGLSEDRAVVMVMIPSMTASMCNECAPARAHLIERLQALEGKPKGSGL